MHVVQEDIDPNEELLKQIELRETQCFEQVFTRFSILKAQVRDISCIEHREFADRPNYWEYYYVNGKFTYMLMSRELKVIDDIPTLEITFNKELE